MPRFELLRAFPGKWVFWWVLVPNMVVIALWPIGGPNMSAGIFLGGIFALFVSQSPSRIIRSIGVVLLFAYLLAEYIAKSFELGISKVLRSLDYLREVDIFEAPEYVAAALVLALSLLLAVIYAPRTEKLTQFQQKLLAVAAFSILINIDLVVTAETRGSYKVSAPPGTPISSAVLETGIDPDTLKSRNLVVIMVELLGVPKDSHDKAIMDRIWDPARWSDRYDVRRGTTPYFGSTTNGELRELCAVWADHTNYDFGNAHCLPQKFVDSGFETIAMHSFIGNFFDRKEWYPRIGFQRTIFARDLVALGAAPCSGVFPGACDTDVPKVIAAELKKGGKRKLIYWLTVNAHLPIGSSTDLKTDHCDIGEAAWQDRFPMLCRSYKVHQLVANAITRQIMDPGFPDADVLIVGDHMPPFFQRSIRTRFDAVDVPYIYLEWRHEN